MNPPSPAPENPRVPREVWSLGVVSLLNDTASEMVHPLLPLFLTRVLGASTVALGLVEGVAESTAALMKLVAGTLSDRFGRRKPWVVAGYLAAALSRPLIGLTNRWGQVLALRFVDRLGKGIRTSPRDALIADLTPRSIWGKAFGIQRSLDHSGALLGPLVATLLLGSLHLELRPLFLLAVVPGLAAVLVLALRVHEPHRPLPRPREHRGFPIHREDWYRLGPQFHRYLAALLVFTLGNATDAFLVLKARQVGIALAWIPTLWMLFNGVKMVLSTPCGMFSDRHGRRRTILMGWFLYGLVYLGFALATTTWQVVWLFASYGVFYALTEGVERAFVADLVPETLRGTGFGWFHLTVGLAALPASVLFGLLWHRWGSGIAFLTGALLAWLALGILGLWVHPEPSSRPEPRP